MPYQEGRRALGRSVYYIWRGLLFREYRGEGGKERVKKRRGEGKRGVVCLLYTSLVRAQQMLVIVYTINYHNNAINRIHKLIEIETHYTLGNAEKIVATK